MSVSREDVSVSRQDMSVSREDVSVSRKDVSVSRWSMSVSIGNESYEAKLIIKIRYYPKNLLGLLHPLIKSSLGTISLI